jgi:hypothetical protein
LRTEEAKALLTFLTYALRKVNMIVVLLAYSGNGEYFLDHHAIRMIAVRERT